MWNVKFSSCVSFMGFFFFYFLLFYRSSSTPLGIETILEDFRVFFSKIIIKREFSFSLKLKSYSANFFSQQIWKVIQQISFSAIFELIQQNSFTSKFIVIQRISRSNSANFEKLYSKIFSQQIPKVI